MTTMFTIAFGSKAPAMQINLEALTNGLDIPAIAENPALRYLVEYGLKQSLNDAIAAIKTSDKDYSPESTTAIIQKRLDAIIAGTVRTKGSGDSVAADPYAVEARKLARIALKAKDDQAVKSAIMAVMKARNVDAKEATKQIVVALAATPDIAAQAKANVNAANAKAADMADGIDLTELFGGAS